MRRDRLQLSVGLGIAVATMSAITAAAVMGVRDATKRFKTGMEVTVDGSTGRVEIMNDESE